MNSTDRDMLTAFADLAARFLDVPRPLIAPTAVATAEESDAWFTEYRKNDAAYESLVRERTIRVEVLLRHLAAVHFDELAIKSVTEQLAGYLAEPLPYPVES